MRLRQHPPRLAFKESIFLLNSKDMTSEDTKVGPRLPLLVVILCPTEVLKDLSWWGCYPKFIQDDIEPIVLNLEKDQCRQFMALGSYHSMLLNPGLEILDTWGDGNGSRSRPSNAITCQICGVLGSGNITLS